TSSFSSETICNVLPAARMTGFPADSPTTNVFPLNSETSHDFGSSTSAGAFSYTIGAGAGFAGLAGFFTSAAKAQLATTANNTTPDATKRRKLRFMEYSRQEWG